MAEERNDMPFGIGRIMYPLAVVLVVGTTWCLAWARSVSDQSDRGYWPAKDPELMRRVTAGTYNAPASPDRNAPQYDHAD
jgi:hypothetical protein